MNNNEWLDIDVLEDYLDGKLDAKTMHRVERISLEDPFVAEALAGLSKLPKRAQSLSLLQKQLQERIAQKPVEQRRWQITSQRLSIAAAAAVLFVTVSLLFWMREKSNREQLAANTPKKVEVSIAAKQAPEKPTISEKPIIKAKEVERMITEAKKNTYASNSRKVAYKAAEPSPNNTLSSLEVLKKKEVVEREFPSAVKAKIAGSGVGANTNSINGVVYGDDKLPIPGASIKIRGTSQGTVTDDKGRFSLTLDSMLKDPKLNVAYLGFMQKEVAVKKNDNLTIELKQDSRSLNEVVVTAAGTNTQKRMMGSVSAITAIGPEPVGGWNAFEVYLLNHNRLLIDRKVTGRFVAVSFEVNKRGRAIRIKAVKMPLQTKAEEKEAIRLIRKGPRWIVPKNGSSSSTRASVNIKF